MVQQRDRRTDPIDVPLARILLASPLPPPIGGIATWTEEVLATSLRARFALDVFDSAWDERGVRARSRWGLRRAIGAVVQLARYQRVLRRTRPVLVHVSSSYHWGFLRDGAMVLIARALGTRVVLHLHGGDFGDFLSRLPRALQAAAHRVLRACDRIIVLDSGTEATVGALVGNNRTCRLPNAVAVPDAPAARAPGAGQPVRIVYVGALIEAKGVLDLLTAFQSVRGAVLTLVGPLDASFAPRLRSHPALASPNVAMLAECPRSDVLTRIAESDLFVLPSHREGLPLSLLEAMAAGCAIVTTSVGAIPDVLRDGVEGRLVPPSDPEALGAAIQMLVDSPAQRAALGRAAHARARECYTREALAVRLAAVWGEVLATTPRISGAS